MIKKLFDNLSKARHGVALFVAMLMSMSLAVVAVASMSRLSEVAHASGKGLQERKLLMYAQSAANIVNGKVQELINSHEDFLTTYEIFGNTGEGSFVYYPRDIFVNPDISGLPTIFGYRARATLVASEGDTPPGFRNSVPAGWRCYDIMIDVREVLYLPSGNIDQKSGGKTDLSRYYMGKMKTVGTISCFEKG